MYYYVSYDTLLYRGSEPQSLRGLGATQKVLALILRMASAEILPGLSVSPSVQTIIRCRFAIIDISVSDDDEE